MKIISQTVAFFEGSGNIPGQLKNLKEELDRGCVIERIEVRAGFDSRRLEMTTGDDRTAQETWEDSELIPDMTDAGRRWFLEQRRKRKMEQQPTSTDRQSGKASRPSNNPTAAR